MKRLKLFFAVGLLLLALPFWRFVDMVAIASPIELLTTLGLTTWFAIFIAIPIKLLKPQIKTIVLVLSIFAYGFYAYWFGPLSGMATTDPAFNHCGRLTYTSVFYPIRNILTDAHLDDLEVRNQLCWLRKMISRVPSRLEDENELKNYSKLISDKLMKPEIKFRASLPLIAMLNIRISMASNFAAPFDLYRSLHFWMDHYTEEISERSYSWWNWPHSDYIKFEYGLIEKNWQKLIDSIVLEAN